MKFWRPLLVLLAVASLGPELVSGNTPLHQFLSPATALLMLFAYGLVILLTREFMVRLKFNTTGLFLCGLAYGLVNEGLLAKTIFLRTAVPIPQYDDYGYALGLNWPWMVGILLWHALLSVMFPITLVHWLYPEQATTPWLSKRLSQLLALLVIALGSLIYFGPERGSGTWPGLIALWVVIGGLAVVASRFQNKASVAATPRTWGPFWLGMATGPVYYIGFSMIAGNKLPVLFFALCWALSVALFSCVLSKKRWSSGSGLLLFLCGAYVFTALIAILAGLAAPSTLMERAAVGVGSALLFLHLARRVLAQHQR